LVTAVGRANGEKIVEERFKVPSVPAAEAFHDHTSGLPVVAAATSGEWKEHKAWKGHHQPSRLGIFLLVEAAQS
jgi:hypothetical protein